MRRAVVALFLLVGCALGCAGYINAGPVGAGVRFGSPYYAAPYAAPGPYYGPYYAPPAYYRPWGYGWRPYAYR
jgi:hypothetical protein